MGKDKRKGKKRGSSFDYHFGTGEIGRMMDRYDIKGTKFTKPDNRGVGSGGDVNDGTPRTRDDVDKDIAKAMMADYDTRRGMEAAALAGDKEAKKFAKKGFKQGNIYSAWDTMKALKKEHVGGGGMRGPKNEAGLTHALVKHDRDVFNKSIDERIAAAIPKEAPAADSGAAEDPEKNKPSKQLEQAQNLVSVYQQDLINNYVDDYGPNATGESIAALQDSYKGTYARQLKSEAPAPAADGRMTASDFANVYKENVKGSLKPA